MLEFIDIDVEGVVAYRLDGKISTEEMNRVLDVFRKTIAAGNKLNLYQEITGLGGLEFEALGEKLKFFLEFGLSDFGRVAVVADKKWIPRLIDLEGRLLKKIELRGFSMDEKATALSFLKGE
ncbi:MAG: STAS/SEC14 domain-containing protein [Desulfobacterales bacterium]|nr:STAS/SEC14 domain-containing protein [Desulfobacterales bacterium]